MRKLPLVLLGAAILTGCSTVQPHHPTTAGLLTLSLPGVIQTDAGTPCDLNLRLAQRDGKWTAALATLYRWNAAAHRVDVAGLTWLPDGTVTGQVAITLLPDAWLPKDQQPVRGHISLRTSTTGTNVVGQFAAEFAGKKTTGAITGTSGSIPAAPSGDKAGMLRTFLPQPDGKLAEAVFRFEARGSNVVRLDTAKLGVSAVALTFTGDRLRGTAKLAGEAATFELSCIGDAIGGSLAVGSHLLSVTGRLESRADLFLQNRPEKLNPHSAERQQSLQAAIDQGGAAGLAEAFAKHTWKAADGVVLPYRLFTPRNLVAGQKYPLVVLLHGAGQDGTDNERQLNHWPKYWATAAVQTAHPCFVLVPQATSQWSQPPTGAPTNATTSGQMVIQIVRDAQQRLPVDSARLYVTGLSRGGYGTCYVLAEAPDLFAAGVPVCGAAAKLAPRIGRTPIWIFHGDADPTVPVTESRNLVKALRQLHTEPLYTEYHLVGHNSYFYAFTNPALFEWLFAQHR